MAYFEVLGSRRLLDAGKRRLMVRVGLSDNLSGIPAVADLAPGDSGLSARVCTRVNVEPEALPGRSLVTSTYEGYVAYT